MKESLPGLREDGQGKAELALMLRQCFDGLKLYGKDPETLTNTVSLFVMVLGDYPMEKIRAAFAFYLKTSSEMPTPADIATIISRGNKPAFDRAVYLSIKQKLKANGDAFYAGRTVDEDYVADYDRFQTQGVM